MKRIQPLGVAIAGYAIGIIMLLRPQLALMGIGDFIVSFNIVYSYNNSPRTSLDIW
jgi:hypothetical protein